MRWLQGDLFCKLPNGLRYYEHLKHSFHFISISGRITN